MSNAQGQAQQTERFTEIELEKTFEALLQVQNLRIQLGTFFGTVNLAALGIAFGSKVAAIVILAGALLGIFVLLDIYMRRAIVIFCLRLVRLYQCYKPGDESYQELTIMMWTRDDRIMQISALPSMQQRMEKARQLPLRDLSVVGFYLPFLAGLTEVIVGLVLVVYSHWPLVG